MKKLREKMSAVAFWVLIICGYINAVMFFLSLSIPQFSHLKQHHLLMLTFCTVGCIVNYIVFDKLTKRR